jgi:mannitol-1-/sugar-/sorbitol-6-phosphatase
MMLRNRIHQGAGLVPNNSGICELVCDAVLFDLDGTLVDSTKVVERLWAEWATRHSLNVEDILAISHGRRAEDTMRLMAPHLKTLKEEAEARLREEELQSVGLAAVAGAKTLLSHIPQARWAIVTSCTRTLAEVRLRSVGLPVPAVLISEETIPLGKPHPEGYLEAARILGWAPRNCLVVEDSPIGVEAGLAAGMRVLGVSTTYPADQLSANLCVADLSEVAIVPGVPLTIRVGGDPLRAP